MTFEISKISIPKEPGIYLMKDSKGEIIYIGKAKNLKNRVKSYFLKNQNYKTQKLVSKNADLIVLNSLNDKGAGFNSDTNKVTFVYPDNKSVEFELKSKIGVANDIANTVKKILNE